MASDFDKLNSAAQQYREALGIPDDPAAMKLAASINKLGKEHNVLISYEIRELPSHGVSPTAKPKACHCLCVCACAS
jgi:hypothetical protein